MSRPRKRSSGQDSPAGHSPRTICVLTEGAVTEPRYLVACAREYDARTNLFVDRVAAGHSPLAMVTRARALRRKLSRRNPEFDEIWCVFDVNAHPDVPRAVAEARDAGISTAVSNPCFELWLVLHAEDWVTHVDRHTIQSKARQLELVKGKHISDSALPTLLDGYDDAKRRAKYLDVKHDEEDRPPGANPSSGVWRLIDTIRGEPWPE